MELQAAGLKRCITIFTILLWNSLVAPSAFAHPIVQYWQNRTTSSKGLVFEPRLSFYSTSQNYEFNGDKIAIANGLSVSRLYLDFNFNYSASDRFYLFGRASIVRSQITNPISGDASSFSPADQLLGAAYRLIAVPDGLSLSLQVDATIPAYSNGTQKLNGQPYPGDGSYDFVLGSFIEAPLSSARSADWFGEAGIGYRVRSNAFSSALPWSLMLKREPADQGLLLNAGLRGQISLDTDVSSPTAARVDQLLGAGGSYLIYAINPSWMVAQATIGYQTHPGQSVYALAAFPVSGKNAPSGLQLSLGAQFDFGGGSNRPASSRSATVIRNEVIDRPTPVSSAEARKSGEFVTYNLVGRVTSINDQLYVAKVDKGLSDGVEKGQMFDIYKLIEEPGSNERKEVRIARARVTAVKNSEAALSVVQYFIDQWIEIGFIAKRLVE